MEVTPENERLHVSVHYFDETLREISKWGPILFIVHTRDLVLECMDSLPASLAHSVLTLLQSRLTAFVRRPFNFASNDGVDAAHLAARIHVLGAVTRHLDCALAKRVCDRRAAGTLRPLQECRSSSNARSSIMLAEFPTNSSQPISSGSPRRPRRSFAPLEGLVCRR